MAAGDLGIVEPNGVRVVPAQGHGTECELEPLSLVGPLDHEQGGHEVILSSARTRRRLVDQSSAGRIQANARSWSTVNPERKDVQ